MAVQYSGRIHGEQRQKASSFDLQELVLVYLGLCKNTPLDILRIQVVPILYG